MRKNILFVLLLILLCSGVAGSQNLSKESAQRILQIKEKDEPRDSFGRRIVGGCHPTDPTCCDPLLDPQCCDPDDDPECEP